MKMKHVGWGIMFPRPGTCIFPQFTRWTKRQAIQDFLLLKQEIPKIRRLVSWREAYHNGWRCVKIYVEDEP